MKCPKCGVQLPDSARFCGKCGVKIEREAFCMSCGAKIPDGDMFCMECGTPVGRTSPQEVDTIKELQESADKDMQFVWDWMEFGKSYKNYGCGSHTTGNLCMSSLVDWKKGYDLYYTLGSRDNSVLGSDKCYSNSTVLEVLHKNGQKSRYLINERFYERYATVDNEKVFYVGWIDDCLGIKYYDTKTKAIEAVGRIREHQVNDYNWSVYEADQIVVGMDGKCYYELYVENDNESSSYLACIGKEKVIGYDESEDYPEGHPEFSNDLSKKSNLHILAYNRRYIYIRSYCGERPRYFIFDIKTQEIVDLYEQLPEKYREKELMGIDALNHQVLLAKGENTWPGFDSDGINRDFITVKIYNGEETDWHTEKMAEEPKGNYLNYAAFDNNTLIYGKVREDENMSFNDKGEYVYTTANSKPFGVIVYDSNHNVKYKWLVDGKTEANCSGLIQCAGGYILRLWINDPVTGEPLQDAFWGSVEFSDSEQRGKMRPQFVFGVDVQLRDRDRLREIYKSLK